MEMFIQDFGIRLFQKKKKNRWLMTYLFETLLEVLCLLLHPLKLQTEQTSPLQNSTKLCYTLRNFTPILLTLS